MHKVTVHFVEFLRPGIVFAESTNQEVPSPDPAKVAFPNNAYAFRMYKRVDVVDGEECFQGIAQQIGGTFYHPDSRIETFEEVKKNPNASQVLIDNMRINGWDSIVWSRWGNWPQPLGKGDVILQAVAA